MSSFFSVQIKIKPARELQDKKRANKFWPAGTKLAREFCGTEIANAEGVPANWYTRSGIVDLEYVITSDDLVIR